MYSEQMEMVLVHGSWQTGESFAEVAKILRSDGHVVHTPTIAGHGVNADKSVSHADQAASVVRYIVSNDLSNIVLIGHSFGGTIIAKVVEELHERIRRLVFWNAFVLQDGNCILDEVPPHFRQLFSQLSESTPDKSIELLFPIWREGFLNDASLKVAQESSRLLSSEPKSSMFTQLDFKKFYELIASQKLACSYLYGTADVAMPPGEFSWYPRFANRLGLCRMVEFAGASHAVYVSRPEATAYHLIKAGRD